MSTRCVASSHRARKGPGADGKGRHVTRDAWASRRLLGHRRQWHDTPDSTRRVARGGHGWAPLCGRPAADVSPVCRAPRHDARDRTTRRARARGRHPPARRRRVATRSAPRYHDLRPGDGGPPRADRRAGPVPPTRRAATWGWTAQLYAARSRTIWGIGDLGAATLARWSAGWEQACSPSTRCMPRSRAGTGPQPVLSEQPAVPQPLYLRIEDVPGFRTLTRRSHRPRRRADHSTASESSTALRCTP